MAVPKNKSRKKKIDCGTKFMIKHNVFNKYTLDKDCLGVGQKQLCFKQCKSCLLKRHKTAF